MEVKRILRPYSDKFSKKTYTQHQHTVAILLMKRERKPYRDVVELLKEFCAYFWVQQVDITLYHFGEVLHADNNLRLGLLARKNL